VGIFANKASIARLVGALLLEQNEEWQPQRRSPQLEGLQALGDNAAARLFVVMS
jgi:putative transposase